MTDDRNLIRESILRDMSEGVITIGLDGMITTVNPAAAAMLGRSADTLLGKAFAGCFFEYEENDAFNQLILDAVYDAGTVHEGVVPYFTGTETKQFHVTTSYLLDGEKKIAVIAVIGDISELMELRDAIRAMERIQTLNTQLEMRNRLLSETFGRFLSDDIVKQLLDTPDGLALGGKKRYVTVMMSDLRGFTAKSENMPAQDLVEMLNDYLDRMTTIIEEYNGTIIEFLGDGILALFGAPTESSHHAADAVATAIRMQAEMENVNRVNRERGYPMLEMGIGINTGEVIVGNIGSERRTKYGAVGTHVNLCGRIESYSVGGQVLISPTTRAAIREELTVVGEQEVLPKGINGPLTLTQVSGIGGTYQVFCAVREDEPDPLSQPVKVSFRVIRDKHCNLEQGSGMITALSDKRAVLVTEDRIGFYDNLQIDIGGELFAKVITQNENGFLLHFTSLPDGFPEWKKTVVG